MPTPLRLLRRSRPNKRGAGLVLALLTLGSAAAVAVPLPPSRPADLVPAAKPALPAPALPAPAVTPPTPAPPSTLPPPVTAEDTAACDRALAGGVLRAERVPPLAGAEGCGVGQPIKLSAIKLVGSHDVQLLPPVTIRCALANALGNWIQSDLAPLLATRHGGLAKLSGMGGYECRGRNRVPGAKLSEHATGNAVDVQAFVLGDGSVAKITDVEKDEALFAQVKITTCARFSTVLGPGSDGYHEDNLHLDLEPRRNGAHFCRWQLP